MSRFRRSVWDRLITPETPGQSAASDEEALKDELRRDLQNLLNSRRCAREEELDMPELQRSLLAFGIPEISAVNPNSSNDRHRLSRTICDAIEHFEPRLSEVEVEHVPGTQGHEQQNLHFRIRAVMKVEGRSDPIIFDTALELGSRSFQVNA